MAESLSACRRHFLSRRIHRGPVSCFVATRFLAPYPAWSRSNRSPVRSPGRRAASMATSRVGGADGVVVKAPSGSTKSTVIFLHGLGDTARGWTDAFPLEGLPSTRYVLPTAEVMPVSLNMGFRMVRRRARSRRCDSFACDVHFKLNAVILPSCAVSRELLTYSEQLLW